jgi:hypothetical protein
LDCEGEKHEISFTFQDYKASQNYEIFHNYGISQNPDAKDYILVIYSEHFEKYCEKCDNKYEYLSYKWNVMATSWTSGNEKINTKIWVKKPFF